MNATRSSFASIKKHVLTNKTSKKKTFKIKPASVVVYFGVFALLIAMVSAGYHTPQKAIQPVANVANVNTNTNSLIDQTSVDNVIASGVAAGVAQMADLPIADNVMNMAVSTQVKSELDQLSAVESAKPQIVQSNATNRDITSYTAVSGDTVAGLAAKFGISAQTIKWANNLTSENIPEGKMLKILPVDGVLYSVKSTDTIDSVAARYGVDKTRVVAYNDLEVSGLVAGTDIILPSGTLPETERPGYVAPRPVYNYSYSIASGYDGGDVARLNTPPYMSDAVQAMIPHLGSLTQKSEGNKMYLGNCTWWAWERRKALGKELPALYGNAGSWAYTLSNRYGLAVDKNPRPGDVFESAGHVGIVERLNTDANGKVVSLTTSEMNWGWIGYLVVERTIPASNFTSFNYIH